MLDAIVISSVDMTFDLAWRRDEVDTTLATWQQHFEPKPAGDFTATAYELDQPAAAYDDFQPGDQLIFRYTAANTTSVTAWIPNGDGATTNGRIPNFTLPK